MSSVLDLLRGSRQHLIVVLAIVGLLVAPQTPVHGQGEIHRVCVTASCDWSTSDSFFTNLRAAIAAADEGDEVWVAAGTYIPTGCNGVHPLECSFELKGGVELYGNFCGTEPGNDLAIRDALDDQCITILSGEFNVGSEDGRVLHVVRADGSGLHYIDGFTITRGWARGWVDADPTGPTPNTEIAEPRSGGGLFSTSADLGVVMCRFTDNVAGDHICFLGFILTFQGMGGGAAIYGDGVGATARFHNCRFDQNAATIGWDIDGQVPSSPIGPHGGGLFVGGGQSTTQIMNCIFHDNIAATAPFFDCDNKSYPGGHAYGGAIATAGACVSGPSPVIDVWNTVVFGNRAEASGSHFGVDFAGQGGGVFAGPGSQIQVRNSIVWENVAVDGTGPSKNQFEVWSSLVCTNAGNLDVDFSNVEEGGWSGPDNIMDPPLFVDAPNGNFRLTANSPCIDAGVWSGIPKDQFNIARTGLTYLPVPDLDLKPRVAGCYVDMGAYEYLDPPSVAIPADLNRDCCVDFQDILILLNHWGPCTDLSNCPSDLNSSGTVDFSDLILMLAAYGEGANCPSGLLPIETVDDCFERIGLSNIEALAACIEAMMTQE